MVYFFDTSALVNRYHQETGTEIVDAAFGKSEVTRLISDLGVIEFYSAFAKKVRTGEIAESDYRDATRMLAKDVQEGQIQVLSLDDDDKREAVDFIETYGPSKNLRTLDPLQLAVLNSLDEDRTAEVYCADQPFVKIIEQEGFSVTNPEDVEGS